MFKNKFFRVFLMILVSIPTFFTLLRPGYYPMHDDQHIFRLYEMDKCIKDGQIPCRWVPDAGYGYGYPQFNFYAPSIYYFGEGLHFIGLQFVDAIKIIIILGFILSAIGMYLLVREFFGDFVGLVSGVLYIYSPYKAQQVYVRGALSEFWAGVFFPLILWSSYKAITDGRKKYTLLTALFLGILLTTHNLLSMLFLPIVAVWVVYWLYKKQRVKESFKRILVGITLGITLSSFFVLPVIFEKQFVHTETLIGGYFDYRQHFVSVKELFVDNNWGYGSSILGPTDDINLSAGHVHWLIGFAAIFVSLFFLRKDKKISLLVIGVGAIELFILFMMHERSSFIWRTIPQLAYVQFPWRLLSYSALLLSFMSGYLLSKSGKLKSYLGILLVILVLILYGGFFKPKSWFETSDRLELSGEKYDRQLTSSIGDYLPIYAKLPPDKKAGDLPEIIKGEVVIADYHKGTDYQSGILTVSGGARVRLPLFDFPGMTVYIDGKRVPHINDDCTGENFCKGLISFDVPDGKHEFRVQLENTPVRLIGNWISLLGAVVFVFLAVKSQKNEK